MNVMAVQHAVYLQKTHTKHMHVCRSSMAYCTSTTLSNMCAKGRKEMSTSLLLGFSVPWTENTGGTDRREGQTRGRRDTRENRERINLSETGVYAGSILQLNVCIPSTCHGCEGVGPESEVGEGG